MVPKPPSQLTLDLTILPRFETENFLISASNDVAYALVETWPKQPGQSLMLVGPSGSGKSHLGAIWAKRSQALVVQANHLGSADLQALANRSALLIEDLHALGNDIAAETALFHLINLSKPQKTTLLFTSRLPAAGLQLQIPDLSSRLREATLAEIGLPDEALIHDVIVKLFIDRQLVVDTGVVQYISLHVERSLAAALTAVEALDAKALALGKRISKQMVADVLDVHARHDETT